MSERRVWILGAGFSKPLGGPLLVDLLSFGKQDEIEANYPSLDELQVERTELVYQLYHYGNQFFDGPLTNLAGPGRRWWRHAEEFLSYLDLAAVPGHGLAAKNRVARCIQEVKNNRRKLPERSMDNTVEELAITARRIVAAECCAFVKGYDVNAVKIAEPWDPFVRWARSLDENDTVITFNYDRVVELASKAAEEGVAVIVDSESEEESEHSKQTQLFKLHGSVDWQWDGSRIRIAGEEHALDCQDGELLVATPGPTKKGTVEDKLNFIWKRAEQAIMRASEVNLIGFWFPETDSVVRRRVLKALRESPRSRRFRVVLGPNNSGDVARVKSLLNYGCGYGAFEFEDTHLYSQDFLAVQA